MEKVLGSSQREMINVGSTGTHPGGGGPKHQSEGKVQNSL